MIWILGGFDPSRLLFPKRQISCVLVQCSEGNRRTSRLGTLARAGARHANRRGPPSPPPPPAPERQVWEFPDGVVRRWASLKVLGNEDGWSACVRVCRGC